ncbi:hypothetical protein [Amycolatopsis sp. NPDC059657]|uniref:hypothetical protein n=1 Tax=Amycolatopsis sp. NPDC059657 TaxID=3346899 RepID=UPI0036729841
MRKLFCVVAFAATGVCLVLPAAASAAGGEYFTGTGVGNSASEALNRAVVGAFRNAATGGYQEAQCTITTTAVKPSEPQWYQGFARIECVK